MQTIVKDAQKPLARDRNNSLGNECIIRMMQSEDGAARLSGFHS